MNRTTFIAFIVGLGFIQTDPLRWIKSEATIFSHWWIIIHAKNDTFTLCLRDREKCINIPFPESEADLITFFKVVGL
jgi:hypothetical protein